MLNLGDKRLARAKAHIVYKETIQVNGDDRVCYVVIKKGDYIPIHKIYRKKGQNVKVVGDTLCGLQGIVFDVPQSIVEIFGKHQSDSIRAELTGGVAV